jgi:predicted unusual protein kinase regulating ubiquinone biosynthesis (AarF/ABC1/UbiB family)
MNASALHAKERQPQRTIVRQIVRFVHVAFVLGHHYRALRRFEQLSESERAQHRHVPRQFAQSLLDLGPLFIKLGQIASARSDLLPPEYISELARLQEHVPPVPFEQAQAILRDAFGKPIEEVFATFDTEPVAAASLAQTYLATLPGGDEVAVKVQRPLVRDRIEADMAMLDAALRIARRLFPRSVRRLNLVNGFAEYRRYTMQELDFTHEAHTMERFRRNFAGWDDVRIPRVTWSLVTPRALTMERVSGLRLGELLSRSSDSERRRLTHRLMEMEMKMFVADGLFHADLHAGNILFSEDGAIILLDFGMYGELSDEHCARFILYWLAAAQRQTRRAFHHLIQQTTRLPDADEAAYYARFEQLADTFYSSTITQQSLTRTYLDIIVNGARYGFVFPSDLLLQAKALTTAEALALALTPDLRFEREVGAIIAKLAAQRMLDVRRLVMLIERSGPELLLLGEVLPAKSAEPEHAQAESDAHGIVWWDALAPALKHLSATFSPSASLLRLFLDEPTRRVLLHMYPNAAVERMLDTLWTRYTDLSAEAPQTRSIGARLMVHLSIATLAAYHMLLDAGKSSTSATDVIFEIAWDVYARMGAIPRGIAQLTGVDPAGELRYVTEVFRKFPFSAPDYHFEDVTSAEPGVVAFNCLQCPVASVFRARGLGDLCVNTWCKLDYPLARQWNAELRRSGTIAGGAPLCDFRWRSMPDRSSPSAERSS